MNNLFDQVSKVSKTAPYTVPDGFFDEMRAGINQAVERERKRNRRRLVAKWTAGVAAATVVAVASVAVLRPSEPVPSQQLLAQQTVEQTVAGMSDEQLDMYVSINNSDEFLYVDDEMQDYY